MTRGIWPDAQCHLTPPNSRRRLRLETRWTEGKWLQRAWDGLARGRSWLDHHLWQSWGQDDLADPDLKESRPLGDSGTGFLAQVREPFLKLWWTKKWMIKSVVKPILLITLWISSNLTLRNHDGLFAPMVVVIVIIIIICGRGITLRRMMMVRWGVAEILLMVESV